MQHLACAYRPVLVVVLRRQLRASIRGRRIDPEDRPSGRFSSRDISQIADLTLHQLDDLNSLAEYRTLSSAGNRLNTFLAVLTVSVYRALLDFGVPAPHARDLVADAGWRLYRLGTRPLVIAAHLRAKGRQRRLAIILTWLLRFPFGAPGRPGYEVEVRSDGEAVQTTWTWCPPLAYVRRVVEQRGDRGDIEAFRSSWFSYDWALNDLLAGGDGTYSRPHTMSRGDQLCDMTWSAERRRR